MKPENTRRAFLVFFSVLTALFVIITWPFATAAFLAFTLAVIFSPAYRFAEEKCRLPRYVAAVATTLVVAVCVVFPVAVLSGVVFTQIGHFLQGLSAQAQGGLSSADVEQLLAGISSWIERLTGSAPSAADMQAALVSAVETVGKKFYEFSPRVLTTTFSIVANFLLTLLFLTVFLAEGSALYSWIMETSPLSAPHRGELAREVRRTIVTSIVAALLTAIVQGVLLGAGFRLAGFSEPYGWGLIAIILSLIQVIGAASCYITASALLFTAGRVEAAVIFLIFGFGIISTIDNLIRPLVIRGTSRMHPVLLFVVLIGAVKLLGPVGLLVGPVLLSIFLASLRIYRREFVNVI